MTLTVFFTYLKKTRKNFVRISYANSDMLLWIQQTLKCLILVQRGTEKVTDSTTSRTSSDSYGVRLGIKPIMAFCVVEASYPVENCSSRRRVTPFVLSCSSFRCNLAYSSESFRR